MTGWGITLIMLGVGSFVLPELGYQFRLVSVFGHGNEAVAGVAFAGIGALLTGVGIFRTRE